MASSVWITGMVIAVTAIVMNGVVKIIQAAKSGGGKVAKERFQHLEEDLAALEQDLEDARQRIIVLEKIVTDGKEDLRRKIDDLASGA